MDRPVLTGLALLAAAAGALGLLAGCASAPIVPARSSPPAGPAEASAPPVPPPVAPAAHASPPAAPDKAANQPPEVVVGLPDLAPAVPAAAVLPLPELPPVRAPTPRAGNPEGAGAPGAARAANEAPRVVGAHAGAAPSVAAPPPTTRAADGAAAAGLAPSAAAPPATPKPATARPSAALPGSSPATANSAPVPEPANPAPAPDAAGSPSASPSSERPAAPATPSAQTAQTVYARPGDQITIALDGTGWIFTGNGDWKRGLEYLSRSFDSKGTTFVFQAETIGSYSLSFLKQSLATGATTTRLVRVSVLSDADFAKAVGEGSANRSAGGEGSIGNGSGDYRQANRYYEAGLLHEALAAYEANWAPGDPAINDRIANLAFRLKSYDVATRFWKKNLSSTGDVYDQLAIAGLMKSAAATGDLSALRLLLIDVGQVSQVSLREELLAAARFLVESREYGLAVRYLDDYLSRYAGQQGSDEAYYLLGTIYQVASPMQDARKARQYYEKITNLYPTSRYYQRAMDNIVYLDRYFLDIR